jgi:hypothetical protein
MIELPCKDLKVLEEQFVAFLRSELQHPWLASQSILEYLESGTTTIYLRGEREGAAAPTWYVQVTFSGCAGLTQTSADVAAHWAELWFRRRRDQISAELLRPRGFADSGIELVVEEQTYLPIGELGYAGFSREGSSAGAGVPPTHFAFDGAINETSEESAQRLEEALEARFFELMQDGLCRCQLCMPGFDCSVVAGLPMSGIPHS